jgi:hypothetical protein
MSKFTLPMLMTLVLAGVSACDSAKSPDKVQNDVASAQSKASSEVTDAKQAAVKDTDSAQAKMNEKGTDLNNVNAQGNYDVAMAKADGEHKISTAKCDAVSGDAKKACKDQADAQYDLAKAQAKSTLEAQKH